MDELADPSLQPRLMLLFHYCRLQLPGVQLSWPVFREHLARTLQLFRKKSAQPVAASAYLQQFYAIDWFLCCGCLERSERAWEMLFALKTGRSDCLLIDALRARAVRLFPRDEERQESAVSEFWSHLIVSESPQSLPILARYDGQRPLAPWLIRVFQNWHLSALRTRSGEQALPDEEIGLPLPPLPTEPRWHEAFCLAARAWLAELTDEERLVLGLRWRYRMSQREVAGLLGIHEGNVTRRIDKLRDRCLERIGQALVEQGWTGDNLEEYIFTEMGSLLMDDPRLSAEQLQRLIRAKGKELPATPVEG